MASDQSDHQKGGVPPRGWEIPREPRADAGVDADALAQLIEQLLALLPDELRVRLAEAAHALLEALRALIDWCVALLERGAGGGEVEIRDIPIL